MPAAPGQVCTIRAAPIGPAAVGGWTVLLAVLVVVVVLVLVADDANLAEGALQPSEVGGYVRILPTSHDQLEFLEEPLNAVVDRVERSVRGRQRVS